MALYPAPSPSHAEPTLQPSYFTSSLYTEPLRQDIADLISLYRNQYSQSDSPFPAFKGVWCSQGWPLLHFRVFDDRTRESFLNITCRLFLEQARKHEPLFARIAALFALYTFYSTQPLHTTPVLWHLKHVPIPIGVFNLYTTFCNVTHGLSTDEYRDLQVLKQSLPTSELNSLQPTSSYILQFFEDKKVFVLLPESSSFPENPRQLPREIYVDRGRITSLNSSVTKKGRPSKNDKTRKTTALLGTLERWLENTRSYGESLDADGTPVAPSSSSVLSKINDYTLCKTLLLEAIDPPGTDSGGHSAIMRANQLVLQRLKEIRSLLPQENENSSAGVGRVENAMKDMEEGHNRGGILDLLQGSGKR